MTARRVTLPFLLAVGLSAAALPALAQSWTADLYAGGTQQTALAGRTADLNLIGNLRYAGGRESFLYLAAAAPLDAAAIPWAAGGVGGRFGWGVAARAGLDLSAHGYAYDGRELPDGGGGTLHLLPYLGWSGDAGAVEVRAGRHEHRFRYGDETAGRGVYEVGVRAGTARGSYAAQLTGRWVADDTASYPFAGLEVGAALGSARFWGSAGRWLADAGSNEWSAGASVDVARIGELWVGLAGIGRDPLYLNEERTSWNVGVSLALGRRPRAPTLPAAAVRADGVVFRLPRTAVGNDIVDAPSVAGEFSDWKPLPMRLVGEEWTLHLPVPRGVYRFSFVNSAGVWFVPEGYPGRLDDGMGGWVAVLVVQ